MTERWRRSSERPVDRAGAYEADHDELLELTEKIVSVVDGHAFESLADRHRDQNPYPGPGKYLDFRHWIGRHVVHAAALGLTSGPSRRVLDIGTGTGYFPFVLSQLGHDCVAVDLDANPMFNDIVGFLRVDRRVQRVRARQELDDFGGSFDWVTAFNLSFNRYDRNRTWDVPAWRFFLHDLASHQLAAQGQVFLKLNPQRKAVGQDKAEVLEYFASAGAELRFPFVHFPSRERMAGS